MQFGSDEHDVGYIARMQVRQWLMARTDLFRFEVAPLLVGLHALAARVDVEAFDVAIRKGISGEQTLPTILVHGLRQGVDCGSPHICQFGSIQIPARVLR